MMEPTLTTTYDEGRLARMGARPDRGGAWHEDGVIAAFTLALCGLLGAPAGLLWSALAPHADVVINAATANAASSANFANPITEDFIAADTWFAGVTLVAGLLCGLVVWWLARGSGPYVVVALAVGGLIAAFIAAEVGMRPGQDALQAAADAGRAGAYVANVTVQSTLTVVLWPTAALAAFLALVVGRPDEV